jgi:hypothetical protein
MSWKPSQTPHLPQATLENDGFPPILGVEPLSKKGLTSEYDGTPHRGSLVSCATHTAFFSLGRFFSVLVVFYPNIFLWASLWLFIFGLYRGFTLGSFFNFWQVSLRRREQKNFFGVYGAESLIIVYMYSNRRRRIYSDL